MANRHSFNPKFQFLVFILVCIQCIDAKLNVNNNHFYPFNFEQIKFNLFSNSSDFPKANKFSEFNSKNWTEHHQCLKELNAIKNGLNNFEPWAIQCK